MSRSLIAFLSLLACAPVHADTLFSDNLQDGLSDGWTTSGTAFVNLSGVNYSIGLRGAASARRTISTSGHYTVSVALQMAASSLETGEKCIAEISTNGGSSWTNALTVNDVQDSGALYSISAVNVNADNNANFVVRFRGTGTSSDDYCYGDNVTISGRPGSAGGAPAADSFDALSGSGAVSRSALTHDTLTKGVTPGSRIDLSAYAVPSGAATPSNFFQGKLTLHNTETTGGFAEHGDTYNYTGTGDTTRKHLPPFEFDFVQTGTHLFPVLRGSNASSHPEWEYVLTPGRVWNENSDNGYTRAAIPFALQQKNANCMHNGVMMFLFKNTGAVSNVAYQISSETCLYFKVDLWGMQSAAYTQQPITNAATLKTAYQSEVNNRIPVKALSSIGADYSGVDGAKLATPNGRSAAHNSLVGFYVNGTHYVGGCGTRNGAYPYCASLVVPSYSTAKSAFGGVAMMRLEKKYPGTRNAFVGTSVGECQSNGNWNDVTLNHLLDMATGNYVSPDYMTDEGASHTENLFLTTTHASKVAYSCTQFTRQAAPGAKWVYHTSDTYLAGTQMNALLKNQEGSSKDVFNDLIVADLWTPLGLSETAKYTRRTYDTTAQPFTGWGLMWTRDDVAKIGRFLNIDDGVLAGTTMLDATQLNAALQRSAGDRGVVPVTDYYYNNGFWAHDVKTGLSCANTTWVPFMSGYGGITVLLLPNDTVYYYFADDDASTWMDAARESAKIRPICN